MQSQRNKSELPKLFFVSPWCLGSLLPESAVCHTSGVCEVLPVISQKPCEAILIIMSLLQMGNGGAERQRVKGFATVTQVQHAALGWDLDSAGPRLPALGLQKVNLGPGRVTLPQAREWLMVTSQLPLWPPTIMSLPQLRTLVPGTVSQNKLS